MNLACRWRNGASLSQVFPPASAGLGTDGTGRCPACSRSPAAVPAITPVQTKKPRFNQGWTRMPSAWRKPKTHPEGWVKRAAPVRGGEEQAPVYPIRKFEGSDAAPTAASSSGAAGPAFKNQGKRRAGGDSRVFFYCR